MAATATRGAWAQICEDREYTNEELRNEILRLIRKLRRRDKRIAKHEARVAAVWESHRNAVMQMQQYKLDDYQRAWNLMRDIRERDLAIAQLEAQLENIERERVNG